MSFGLGRVKPRANCVTNSSPSVVVSTELRFVVISSWSFEPSSETDCSECAQNVLRNRWFNQRNGLIKTTINRVFKFVVQPDAASIIYVTVPRPSGKLWPATKVNRTVSRVDLDAVA